MATTSKRKRNKAGHIILSPKKIKAKRKQAASDAVRAQEDKALEQLLNSAATTRYGGAESALAQEVSRTQGHHRTIDQAFNSYRDRVGQLLSGQQAAMAQAAGAQAAVASGVAGMQSKLGAQQGAQAQEQAKLYGLDGGAQAQQAAQLAGQLGNVSGLRAQAQAGSTAAIGLAGFGQLQQQALAGEQQRGLMHSRNRETLGLLGAKGQELALQKGAYKDEYKQKLKTQAEEMDIARAGLGLKEDDSRREMELALLRLEEQAKGRRSLARDRKADNRLAARKREDDQRAKRIAEAQKDRELDQRDRALDIDALGKGAQPRLTNAQKNAWKQKKATLIALRETFRSAEKSGSFDSTEDVSKYLGKKGYSRDEINMARDLAYRRNGSLSKINLQAARAYFPGGIVPKGFVVGRKAK